MNDDNGRFSPAHIAAWAFLVLVVVGLMGYSFWKKSQRPPLDLAGGGGPRNVSTGSGSDAPKPQDLAVWSRVKQFSLTDQDGKRIEAKDLLGEVWVANFVFTRCAGTCPLLTRQMIDLNKELSDLPNVKLISFSMDPENDTPEVLREYARSMGAVSPRWKFLTGAKEEIYRLTFEEFDLAVKEASETKHEPILHSPKLVLIDAQGYIRGYFSGLALDVPDPEVVKVLAGSVRKLKALPPVAPGTPFVRKQR